MCILYSLLLRLILYFLNYTSATYSVFSPVQFDLDGKTNQTPETQTSAVHRETQTKRKTKTTKI